MCLHTYIYKLILSTEGCTQMCFLITLVVYARVLVPPNLYIHTLSCRSFGLHSPIV